ncbi:Aste57867_3089 [Aphanomyces stellatus]|uniref:Aste57867_3089 protein n=1 Tax=Aphanomyces stellatus TaxID=120398 RepID=A0A485KAN0_9STRA|nr:hypothetical protein As57867_003080 [Aphanomyces stellatus]VFT80268.1 Aste57867_3089 [Aphanomyces stellatus]
MQYVTLPANPETRLTAKQWLTQQLYHNTDRVFASFPNDSDVFVHTEVHLTATHMELTEMFQRVANVPLQTFVKAYYTNIPSRAPEFVQLDHVEIQGNTRNYAASDMTDAYFNVVEAHFHEAGRCILVGRAIQNDDVLPRGDHVKAHQSMQWLDSRQLNATQILVRVYKATVVPVPPVELFPQLKSDLELTSLDEEALTAVFATEFRASVQATVDGFHDSCAKLIADMTIE